MAPAINPEMINIIELVAKLIHIQFVGQVKLPKFPNKDDKQMNPTI